MPLSHNITYSNITYSKLFALAFDYVDFKTTPAARRTGWLLAACMLGLALIPVAGSGADLSPVEQLGKQLFFDANLSTPVGQSCASCHSPDTGFSGPSSDTNSGSAVYPGAAPGRFGNRKPPSVAYASFSPKRTYKQADETWVGGQFWDGRSDDLIEQAQGPFLNPLEMNNASGAEVVDKVRQARYRPLFERVYGPRALDTAQTDAAFVQIATSIAAYETSREVNAFSSKYDAYLAKRATLTPQEERGLKLFAGQANCTACHPHEADHDGTPPLFTDFTYDNVGAPRNTANPFYQASATVNPAGQKYRDLALGLVVKDDAQAGKVKVPTLRNVGKRPSEDFVKSYLHNGTLKSLKEVVRFYNLRDKEPDLFAPPDVPETVNRKELGNLGLSETDEDDLIAFLETLSDQPASDASSPPQTAPQTNPTNGPSESKDAFRGVRDIIRVERYRHRVTPASGTMEAKRR